MTSPPPSVWLTQHHQFAHGLCWLSLTEADLRALGSLHSLIAAVATACPRAPGDLLTDAHFRSRYHRIAPSGCAFPSTRQWLAVSPVADGFDHAPHLTRSPTPPRGMPCEWHRPTSAWKPRILHFSPTQRKSNLGTRRAGTCCGKGVVAQAVDQQSCEGQPLRLQPEAVTIEVPFSIVGAMYRVRLQFTVEVQGFSFQIV